MKNSIKILLALLVITAFSACKKCYECEEMEYCGDCTLFFQGDVIDIDGCFDTAQEREAFIVVVEENKSIGYTVNCTRTQAPVYGFEIEICDKKSDAESEVRDYETAGYICKAK